MREQFDAILTATMKAEAESANLSEEQSGKILQHIHRESKRRTFVMFSKGKKVLIAAAAIAVLGTMTVIGAGKAASYYSSISNDLIQYQNAEEVKQAESKLGKVPKAVQQFGNGLTFSGGQISTTVVADEDGIEIDSYQEVYINYGEEMGLSIWGQRNEDNEPGKPVKTQLISGIMVGFYEDSYLFLPPDVKPSAADLILEAEGKLYISYGTSEEQRSTFQYVKWIDNGLTYLLNTFNDDYDAGEMLQMAEEIIAAE